MLGPGVALVLTQFLASFAIGTQIVERHSGDAALRTPDWPEMGWKAENMPNPRTDFEACGIPEGSTGLLCDPDKKLTPEGRDAILGLISSIRKETTTLCPSGLIGYPVATVIISQVAPSEWIGEDKVETFEKFCRTLDTNWKISDRECDNGVVLLLSLGDRYAFIQAQQKSHQLLEEQVVANIIDHMKPMLRDADFDGALTQANEHMLEVLKGGSIAVKPLSGTALVVAIIVLVLVLLILGPVFLPLLVMYVCWSVKIAIMPWVMLIDALATCSNGPTRQKPIDPEGQAAERDLRRVTEEMDREETDQTMCPICLEDLRAKKGESVEEGGDITILECQHQYHRKCVGVQLTEDEACPLCWSQSSMDLLETDQEKTEDCQRRLKFYVSRVHELHPTVFYGAPSAAYDRHPVSGHLRVPTYSLYDRVESTYHKSTDFPKKILHSIGTLGMRGSNIA